MNRHFLSLGIAAVSLLAAPLAFAQDTGTPPTTPPQETSADAPAPADSTNGSANRISWSDLDADHDGALSRTEAEPVDSLRTAFDSADSDQDGLLTADEYKAYLATRQQAPEPASATQP